MKVLLLSDIGRCDGGVETSILGIRAQLREKGIDARFLATTAPSGPPPNLADFTCLGTTSRWRTLLQTVNPWAALKLRQVLRDFRPDVVHVKMFLTQLSPLILPILGGTPALMQLEELRALCPTGYKLLPDGRACRRPWGSACLGCLPVYDWAALMVQMRMWQRWRNTFGAFLAPTETRARAYRAEGYQVRVVPYGVPPSELTPEPQGTPCVAYVGRLVAEKGLSVLIRALALLPGVSLRVVGEGACREQFARLARRLGVEVDWLGHVPRDQVAAKLRGAWVQAVPSVWEESFPLVAAEAMMRGTPVVATQSLGEVVRDQRTGLLVPPGDVEQLAGALRSLLDDPARCRQLGLEGRRVALLEYSDETHLNRLLEVYRELRR